MEANKRAVDSVNTSDMWERLEPFAVGDIERVTSSASLAYCDSGQLIKEVTHTVRDCLHQLNGSLLARVPQIRNVTLHGASSAPADAVEATKKYVAAAEDVFGEDSAAAATAQFELASALDKAAKSDTAADAVTQGVLTTLRPITLLCHSPLTAPSRPHPSGMRAARTSLGSGINETRLAALYQTALLASKAGRHADAAALLEEALAQVRRVYGAPSRTVFVARERNLKSTAVIAADGSEQQQVQQQQQRAPPAATPALNRAQSSTSTGALASTHMVTVRDVDSVQVLQGNPVELLIMARLFKAHVYVQCCCCGSLVSVL